MPEQIEGGALVTVVVISYSGCALFNAACQAYGMNANCQPRRLLVGGEAWRRDREERESDGHHQE